MESTPTSLFWVGGSAGAWSVLRILFGIDGPLAALVGWEHWRKEPPENLLGIEDRLAVSGGWGADGIEALLSVYGGREHWRVKRSSVSHFGVGSKAASS